MPTRVSASQLPISSNTMSLGDSYTLDSGNMNDSNSGLGGVIDTVQGGYARQEARERRLTGSTAEGRARKRLQSSNSDGIISLRRPELSNLVSREPINTHSSGNARRRQSIRDQKNSIPSISAQSSPLKRSLERTSSGSYRLNQTAIPRPPFEPPFNQQTRQASGTNRTRLGFETSIPKALSTMDTTQNSFDLLPAVNFDDFHTSLIANEPRLHNISIPEPVQSIHNGRIHDSASIGVGVGVARKSSMKKPAAPEISRSNSYLRRKDSSTMQSGQPSGSMEPMGPPCAPLATRNRRQSQFPLPTTNGTTTRTPTKSVGPGITPSDISEEVFFQRGPSLSQPNQVRKRDISTLPSQQANASRPRTSTTDKGQTAHSILATRNAKSKSLHLPFREPRDYLSSSALTPDHTGSSFIGTSRSPTRSTGDGSSTPSSNKRMSTMPNAFATGLGARTISPTDARRMKRLSMMPNPPPIPWTPPIFQPDPPFPGVRSAAQSPSLIPRKSVTPSSNRNTPDPNRKSYSSGISTSSSTSFNSCRTSVGPARLPQSVSTSRLPTLKPRSESSTLGLEQKVPPVPAIPKAYESPKNEIDQPFFVARKSSLPFDVSSIHSTETGDYVLSATETESLHSERETRQTRALTMDAGAAGESRPAAGANVSKRTLQPLRLPPLNLLPLSTPTAARIAAIERQPATLDLGTVTPPPRYGIATTPSTPMTASRASFFSRSRTEEQAIPMPSIRSASSHYALRSEAPAFSSISSSFGQNASRPAISPFVSSSLPKTSNDFGHLRPQYSGETSTKDIAANTRSTRLTGPRKLISTRAPKRETLSQPASPTEPATPSFGTTLRRKLSLTRRRSASRNRATPEIAGDHPRNSSRHDDMPPPRLPASATWNGPLPTFQATQKPKESQSKRNTSSSSTKTNHEQSNSKLWARLDSTFNGGVSISDTRTGLASLRSSRTVSASVQSATSKELSKESRLGDTPLDQDDLVAEEEMKKLAMKRKDTENAAKELDGLRRRATAKERVSPTQALRMAHLNLFERGEIIDFKDIYFCGSKTTQKHVGDLNSESTNFGYDDERGDYNIVNEDHLAYRYEIVDILGKGSFGQVARCVDHKTGSLVAIKIIRNKKRFHQQALVEVDILQKLREWDPLDKHSMIKFSQSFYFRGHLCISTELLGMNLYEFIKLHDFRGFSLKLIRRFSKQLLNSLILLKGHKVIHCDLKPENILLAHPAHSEIKVIDFGSSCLENEKVYTYIQSRFYRSPEVILGMSYGMPIDMWSLGCILAELLTGYPIFPGENEQEQLACIMEVFGPPEKHLIEKSTRKKLFFDSLGKPRLTVSSKGKRRRPSSKTLQQALKCDDEAFLDFITRCLRWDPDRRLKPDEAITHEFITGPKPNSKTKPQTSAVNSSPIQRYNSMITPAGTRPLPEPPTTSFKNGTAMKTREMPSNSPIKAAAAPKRHSTINGLQTNAAAKRASNGAALSNSALPRVMRLGSGKPDMATAAATASLVSEVFFHEEKASWADEWLQQRQRSGV